MRYELYAKDSKHLVVLGWKETEVEIMEAWRETLVILNRHFFPQPETCKIGIRKLTERGFQYYKSVKFDTATRVHSIEW